MKSQFQESIQYWESIKKIQSLLLLSTKSYLIYLIIHIICQVTAYRRLKAKENFKPLPPELVRVSYERWLLATGSKYCDLTWKLWVFWKIACREEVDAYKGWSQPDIWLCIKYEKCTSGHFHRICLPQTPTLNFHCVRRIALGKPLHMLPDEIHRGLKLQTCADVRPMNRWCLKLLRLGFTKGDKCKSLIS